MSKLPETLPLPDGLAIEYHPLERFYLIHTKLSYLRRSFCEQFSKDADLTQSALRFFDNLYSQILYDLCTQGNLMRVQVHVPLPPEAGAFIALHFKNEERGVAETPHDERGSDWSSVTYTPTPIGGLWIEEKTPTDRSQSPEYAIVGSGFVFDLE